MNGVVSPQQRCHAAVSTLPSARSEPVLTGNADVVSLDRVEADSSSGARLRQDRRAPLFCTHAFRARSLSYRHHRALVSLWDATMATPVDRLSPWRSRNDAGQQLCPGTPVNNPGRGAARTLLGVGDALA